MFLCYLDESGTTHLSDQTKTFVYASLMIPVTFWKEADGKINGIKEKYDLGGAEIHTAWILKNYLEQTKIPNFEKLSYPERRTEFTKVQNANLRVWAVNKKDKQIRNKKKHYRMIFPYTHLTLTERRQLIVDIAAEVGSWTDCRLFCDAIKKANYIPDKSRHDDMYHESFEQVVSRLEAYINKTAYSKGKHALLIADNHKEQDTKLTGLMRKFYSDGKTFWRNVQHIVETPLFVNSELTTLIQVADLLSYSVRRYYDNNETELFDLIKPLIDRHRGKVVGLRHFIPGEDCPCEVCKK